MFFDNLARNILCAKTHRGYRNYSLRYAPDFMRLWPNGSWHLTTDQEVGGSNPSRFTLKPVDVISAGFFMCATHGASLDGESPLWGLAVANH